MKQTAVEFLEEQLNKIKSSSTNMNTWVSFLEKDFKELFTQAKEIENQQRGYSEEEVENILIEYVKTNPTKPYRVVSWFQQIKNK